MPGLTDHYLSRNQEVFVAAPANYTGAVGTTEYVSLKDYRRATIKIQTGAWAAGTAAVTLNEATAVAATGAQALEFEYMYTNAAAVTAPTLVKTAVTSDTFNLSVANALYLIEIDASELSAGFDCLSVAIASPGANADFYSVSITLSDPRYVDAPARLPVGTVD